MQKRLVFPFVFLFVLVLPCGAAGVQCAEAQYSKDGRGVGPIAGPLSLLSPSNTTYESGSIPLNVTSKFLLTPDLAKFCYSLDGENNFTLPIEATFVPIEVTRTYANGTTEKCISSIISYHILNGHALLTNFSTGSHSLIVYAEYQANHITGLDVATVYFTVNDTSNSSAVAAGDPGVSPNETIIGSFGDQGQAVGVPSQQSPSEPVDPKPFFAVPEAAVLTVSAVIVVGSSLACWKKFKR